MVRPLVTGDVATITAWFEGLGPEVRRSRFLVPFPVLDDWTCGQLARVDHRDNEALTALTPGGAVAGIARYIRLPQPWAAEAAVAMADRWRELGIASLLLQRIAARARMAGIGSLTAVCLASNTAALRLLGRLGPVTVSAPEAGLVTVRLNLE